MSKQGVYLGLTKSGRLYVGSVAGGRSRTFDRRFAEHRRQLAAGTHPNDGLQADGAEGLRFIPLVRVRRGDIGTARKIERAVIRALGKGTVNERK